MPNSGALVWAVGLWRAVCGIWDARRWPAAAFLARQGPLAAGTRGGAHPTGSTYAQGPLHFRNPAFPGKWGVCGGAASSWSEKLFFLWEWVLTFCNAGRSIVSTRMMLCGNVGDMEPLFAWRCGWLGATWAPPGRPAPELRARGEGGRLMADDGDRDWSLTWLVIAVLVLSFFMQVAAVLLLERTTEALERLSPPGWSRVEEAE